MWSQGGSARAQTSAITLDRTGTLPRARCCNDIIRVSVWMAPCCIPASRIVQAHAHRGRVLVQAVGIRNRHTQAAFTRAHTCASSSAEQQCSPCMKAVGERSYTDQWQTCCGCCKTARWRSSSCSARSHACGRRVAGRPLVSLRAITVRPHFLPRFGSPAMSSVVTNLCHGKCVEHYLRPMLVMSGARSRVHHIHIHSMELHHDGGCMEAPNTTSMSTLGELISDTWSPGLP